MVELKEELKEKSSEKKACYSKEIAAILDSYSIDQKTKASLYAALEELLENVKKSTLPLEESLREEAFLSYTLSHDLQTPLQAILGFVRIIEQTSRETLSLQGKYYFQMIVKNCQVMSSLVQTTLAFAKVGRQEMTLRPINMESLVKDIFQEISLMFPERKIELRIESLPLIRGDSLLFRQVVVNLLSNSFKFTKNKPLAILEVSAHVDEKEVVFSFKDNGVGFDVEKKERLFNPFQRLHSLQEFEGTGIGLAIVKRIIARHGGRVWADAVKGDGATFCFALPLACLL